MGLPTVSSAFRSDWRPSQIWRTRFFRRSTLPSFSTMNASIAYALCRLDVLAAVIRKADEEADEQH